MPLLKEKETFKKMTLEEFDALPVDERNTYELVDHMVMMSPRPSLPHQRAQFKLLSTLDAFLSGHKCQAYGEIEVKMRDDIFIPDISVVCDPDQFNKNRYDGAPAIVVEILSPGTARIDLFTKLNKYQLSGVKEYWIVSLKGKLVTVHNFEKETVTEYTLEDVLNSETFEGLKIPLIKIFE
nr:MAG TPA: protein of unknown function DUF820 [Bacteriophage sp.]